MGIAHQAAALVAAMIGALIFSAGARAESQAFRRPCSGAAGDHLHTITKLLHAISSMGHQYEGVAGCMTSTGAAFLRVCSGSQGDHFHTKDHREWINWHGALGRSRPPRQA